jgi:hypothetical protein
MLLSEVLGTLVKLNGGDREIGADEILEVYSSLRKPNKRSYVKAVPPAEVSQEKFDAPLPPPPPRQRKRRCDAGMRRGPRASAVNEVYKGQTDEPNTKVTVGPLSPWTKTEAT